MKILQYALALVCITLDTSLLSIHGTNEESSNVRIMPSVDGIIRYMKLTLR
jgi:hypothetical protein